MIKKVVCAILFVLLLSCFTSSAGAASSGAPSTPIKHVVIIMQENHSFDSFFWTYPGVIGGNDTNPSYCNPVSLTKASQCLKPIPFTSTVPSGDLPHSQAAATFSYNGGLMNGFLADTVNKKAPSGNPSAISYYDNSTIPKYWSLASHYTLADMFFSSVASYSQPNHWYMLAGTSPAVAVGESGPQERKQVLSYIPYNIKGKSGEAAWTVYLNQSQTVQTIVDQLSNSNVSWKYYDAPIPSSCPTLLYAIASVGKTCADTAPYDYWNPLEAQNSSYTMFASHFAWRGQIINDTQDGNLPQVSWVLPAGSISDHPPANVTYGQYWVSYVVNTIENSKYWQNTLIVVMWDDFGGFFDTIAPPGGIAPQDGLGFRAPAIIISPYSRVGIDNTVYSFESTLKFIDNNWGIPYLNQRVSSANDIANALNYSQAPLSPYMVPLTLGEIQSIQGCLFSGMKCSVSVAPNGPICQIGCSGNNTAFIESDED